MPTTIEARPAQTQTIGDGLFVTLWISGVSVDRPAEEPAGEPESSAREVNEKSNSDRPKTP
jgi:hypothetical protein